MRLSSTHQMFGRLCQPMTSWIPFPVLCAVDFCHACDRRRWRLRNRRNVFRLSHARRWRTTGMSGMPQSVSIARCVSVAGRGKRLQRLVVSHMAVW